MLDNGWLMSCLKILNYLYSSSFRCKAVSFSASNDAFFVYSKFFLVALIVTN
jgi:hypothetical protein